MFQRYLDISLCQSLQTLEAMLVRAANAWGFQFMSASVVTSVRGAGTERFFSLANTPDEFRPLSNCPARGKRDPVNQHLKRSSLPFAYDQNFYVKAGAGGMWEEHAQHGYRNGIAVALHMADGSHFLLGVDGEGALPSRPKALTSLLADLQLLAVHAQAPAANLLAPAASIASQLTASEIEALKMASDTRRARGRRDRTGPAAAKLSANMRSAMKKLGCSTLLQAVHKSIQLQLL